MKTMRTMKKILAALLAVLFAFAFAACGGDGNPGSGSEGEGENAIGSALGLLTTVWDSYGEEERFAAAGGDMSEENMTMDGPGKFSVSDAAALDTTLGFPEAAVDKIDDAASLMHMMNANTFTCGVYHVKDAGDLPEVSAALKDNILQRQWMCGFPDRLVIMQTGGYVAAFFGEQGITGAFQEKLTAAYPAAETLCDEPVA